MVVDFKMWQVKLLGGNCTGGICSGAVSNACRVDNIAAKCRRFLPNAFKSMCLC